MVKEWKRSTVEEDSNEGCRKWKVIVWKRRDGFVLARKAGPRAKIRLDRLRKEARPASHLGQPHKSLLVWAMLGDR